MSPLVIAFQYFTIKCFTRTCVFIGLYQSNRFVKFSSLVDFILGQKSLSLNCVLVERLTLVITRVSLHCRINLHF